MEANFRPSGKPVRNLVGICSLLLLFSLQAAGQRNNLSFSSDFEGTSPFSIWPTVVGRITQSSTFSREGGFSARVEVVKGDPMIAAGARSEMNLEEIPAVPAEQWFGMSYYIPATWVVDADKLTDILAQWHSASGNPPIAFGINVNSWYVQFSNPGNSGIIPLGTVNKGVWTDVVFHMKWSSTVTGVVEVWINGVKVETYSAANFPKETPGPFFKCGDYKWPWNTGSGELNGVGSLTTDRLIYLDAVRVGTALATYADVAPGATAGGPAITLNATQNITLPTSSLNLNATATDLLSTISAKSWTQVSGPNNANFSAPTALATTASGLVAGTYVFRLTITDLIGLTATATVTVTVFPAVKRPPAANAGAFQTITLPTNFVTLNGSASNDPDGTITSYAWIKLSGPAQDNIASAGSATTQVTNLQAGKYNYQLTVTDNSGLTSTDTVNIFVNAAGNQPPVANAGIAKTITLQNGSAVLDGTNSVDPDGTITSYVWKLISGPSPVNISNTSNPSTPVSISAAGKYVFQLTVTDNGGLSAIAQTNVVVYDASTVNPPPVADAGPDQTILLPASSITLDGSGSSATNSTINIYKWTKLSGPATGNLDNGDQAVATVSNPQAGTYVYQLMVTDGNGSTDAGTVTITVNDVSNQPPVADAGAGKTILLPVNTITLDGTNSVDPDGTISHFSWSKLSGASGSSFDDASSATPQVSGLSTGNYIFQLTVTDNDGASSTAQVKVIVTAAIVQNQQPVANAGINQTLYAPAGSVVLDGSGSTDPDGSIVQYRWTVLSGPGEGTTLSSGTDATTTVDGLDAGIYAYQLSVTDDGGLTATDTVTITIAAADDQSPVANAGQEKTILLPVNSVSLDGTQSTAIGGMIDQYAWTEISGPADASINNAASSTTTASSLQQGVYYFQLTITDNNGSVSSDTVKITVLAAINQPPVANAGAGQTITLPVNTVKLDGTGSIDPDGTLNYQWQKISGPASGNIANAGAASAALSQLTTGTYVYQLTVTDGGGLQDADLVTINVLDAVNQLPAADAGSNRVVNLPVASVTLDGSGSVDPDGTITQYNWSQVSGPSIATFNNSGNIKPVLSGLQAGDYNFQLVVTDNDGGTSTAGVEIAVRGVTINPPPVANAGAKQWITLPANTTMLDGSASTGNGTITYAWSQYDGPGQSTVANAGTSIASISNLTKGTYVYVLTVASQDGQSATDTVNVVVLPMPNQQPTANAGSAITINLPVSSVTLDGSQSSDPDGSISTYAWQQLSGQAGPVINNGNSGSTLVSGLVAGEYIFQLTVTDNNGGTANAQVKVIVVAIPNHLPIASAGDDQVITLPVSNVLLDGSNSIDPDGSITGYSWVKISGTGGTISGATTAKPTVTGLTVGTYVYQLTVTDNNGATSTDNISVVVNPVANELPVANAGSNQVIALPTTTVTLDGSGSMDPDGTIAGYSWTKVSGTGGTINSGATSIATATGLQAGSYTFMLTVTDNSGGTATDTVNVTVNAAPNQAPVANAGLDQTITLPTSSVVLDGSASSDPDGTIATYSWVRTTGVGGSISNAAIAKPTVTSLTAGTYTYTLTVTDNKGSTASDVVVITVNSAANQAPVANAGSNQTITLPTSSVTLDGSASADADGTIASYAWVKTSGTGGTISSATIAKPTVSGLTAGSYTYTLTVTDNKGATSTDNVVITVNAAANQAPVANAGTDQAITLPTSSVVLDGSKSTDADGTIASYAWVKSSGTGGTISSTSIAKPTVSGLTAGTYVYTLTVTDNKGATSTDNVTITVSAANQAPVANAGTDQTITLPTSSVVLDGSKSTDADGTIASYAWVKSSGTGGTISSATIAKPTVSGLTAGTYVYTLTVTDNKGATSTDNVTITVSAANQAPVANAGTDQTITLPTSSVVLDGSKSTDADGTIASYAWVKSSGTGGTISSATIAKPTVSGLTAGTYVYTLTVTDNKGATSTDNVTITVSAANQAPVANAGTDQTITLPTSSVVLDGSKSTDADGTIASYAWVKVTGTGGTISNAAIAKPTVTGLTAGSYTYKLTVTDNKGATATDNVIITVAAANQAPVANAGTDQTITLPTSSVVLDGSKSTDADGTIATYAWVKVTGTGGTISNAAIAKPTVSGLTAGSYTYKLTVTDNKGATATDNVVITVSAATNKAPVANAGTDQTITLPTNSVVLDGSKSTDADGTIASYAWVKVTGTGGTISSSTISKPTVTGLTAGSYTYKLTVTDNKGATSSDNVIITVAAANKAPVANAGTDQTITLPTSSVVLDGSKSTDADGTIASYAWVKVSGTGGTISNAAIAKPTVSSLRSGSYVYKLTVTDNKGATATDQVTITVRSATGNETPDVFTLTTGTENDTNTESGGGDSTKLLFSSATEPVVTDSLLLYPNPAASSINLHINAAAIGKMKVNIFDMTGRILASYEMQKTQTIYNQLLDIARLAHGVYAVEVVIGRNKKMNGIILKQ